MWFSWPKTLITLDKRYSRTAMRGTSVLDNAVIQSLYSGLPLVIKLFAIRYLVKNWKLPPLISLHNRTLPRVYYLYERKILKWGVKLQTNKQTNKISLPNGHYQLFFKDQRSSFSQKSTLYFILLL